LIDERGDALADAGWEAFKDAAERRIYEMIRASLARIGNHFVEIFNELSLYDDASEWVTLDCLRVKGLVNDAASPEHDDDYAERPDEEDLDAAATAGHDTWLRMRQLRDVKKDTALVKADGEPTYRLPDTAYHINKLDRGFDLAINILGADHI